MKGITMPAIAAGVSLICVLLVCGFVLHLIGRRNASAIVWRFAACAIAIFLLYAVLETGPGVGRMSALYIGFIGAALFGVILAFSLNRMNKRP